jgi:hypothetical protein
MKRSEMEHGTRGKRAIFRRSKAELSPAGADEVSRLYDDPVRRLSRKREANIMQIRQCSDMCGEFDSLLLPPPGNAKHERRKQKTGPVKTCFHRAERRQPFGCESI